MKTSLSKILKPAAILALLSGITAHAQLTFNFNDSSDFPGDWTEIATFVPEAYTWAESGGLNDSGTIVNLDADTTFRNYIYPTPLGPLAPGKITAWFKYVDNPDNHTGNPFIIGITPERPETEPYIYWNDVGVEYLFTSVTNRTSIPEQIRGEIVGSLEGNVIGSGGGRPEQFVNFVDNSWHKITFNITQSDQGQWNLITTWDLYNEDGTALVQEDFFVLDYNAVQESDESPNEKRPALNDIIGTLASAENLYLFFGGQGLGERGVVAIDNFSVQFENTESSDWYGYSVDGEGWADASDWLGWVNVTNDPWIWVLPLEKYAYIRDASGWVWTPKN